MRSRLSYIDDVRGWIPWCSPDGEFFLEDDPVLITRNNYDEEADLRNGDLGVITEVFDEPDEDGVVGILLVNDRHIKITSKLLQKMSLGYAVTVHKSQGSQWNTTIVALPGEGLSLTDKTLIYTAATRAIKILIMLGDFGLVEKAVAKGSIALRRNTFMKERLIQLFNTGASLEGV